MASETTTQHIHYQDQTDRPVSRAMSGACVIEYGRLVGNDGGRYLAVEGLVGPGRIEFTVEMASHIAAMLAEAQDHPGYNGERAHVRDCWSDVESDDEEDRYYLEATQEGTDR